MLQLHLHFAVYIYHYECLKTYLELFGELKQWRETVHLHKVWQDSKHWGHHRSVCCLWQITLSAPVHFSAFLQVAATGSGFTLASVCCPCVATGPDIVSLSHHVAEITTAVHLPLVRFQAAWNDGKALWNAPHQSLTEAYSRISWPAIVMSSILHLLGCSYFPAWPNV